MLNFPSPPGLRPEPARGTPPGPPIRQGVKAQGVKGVVHDGGP